MLIHHAITWLATLLLCAGIGNLALASTAISLNALQCVRRRKVSPASDVGTRILLSPAPFISVHVATHNEPPDMVIATLDALAAMDYPAFEVLLLDNNTADAAMWQPVKAHVARLGERFRFFHRKGVIGAKAGALNIGLAVCDPRTRYVAIVDADYQVTPDFLGTAMRAFRDDIQFVQFLQAYRNTLRAAPVVAELSDYFRTFPSAANRSGASLLTGTLSVIAINALRGVGGWPTASITEDAELGVALWKAGGRGLYVDKIVGRGLLPLGHGQHPDAGGHAARLARIAPAPGQDRRRRAADGLVRVSCNSAGRADHGGCGQYSRAGCPCACVAALAVVAMDRHANDPGVIGRAGYARAGKLQSGDPGGDALAAVDQQLRLAPGAVGPTPRLSPDTQSRRRRERPALGRRHRILGVAWPRHWLCGFGGPAHRRRADPCGLRPGHRPHRQPLSAPCSRPTRGHGVPSLIAIPTYNRAHQIGRAIAAALGQSQDDVQVAVIDDGSTDDTLVACRPWFDHPHFVYIGLGANLGTAGAKNAALALLPFDAVTFHDSDDIPHRDKLLRQQRTLARSDLVADPCLPWQINGDAQMPGEAAALDIVLTAHSFLSADGSIARIARTLSLVDDFFPNLQFAAGLLGDWVLINSGLFRRHLFTRIGGYGNSVEEDRELRNRAIMAGANIWFLDDVLMTKYDQADSLTAHAATGYHSERRKADREHVWQAVRDWRSGKPFAPVAIDLSDVGLAFVSRPEALAVSSDIAITGATRAWLQRSVAAAR